LNVLYLELFVNVIIIFIFFLLKSKKKKIPKNAAKRTLKLYSSFQYN
jgi:hypothetical protein